MKKHSDIIKKYEALGKMIEVSKFSILEKLQSTYKNIEELYKIALTTKEVVMSITKSASIPNKFLKTKNIKENVFVFITPTVKNTFNTSYDKLSKILDKEYRSEYDKIVTIGEFANNYARERRWNIIYSTDSDELESIAKIASALNGLFMKGVISDIRYVSFSPQVNNESLVILPVEKANIKFQEIDISNEVINAKNYTFYPSALEIIYQLSSTYIEKITQAIINESKVFYYKQELIRNEESEKAIEEKIDEIKLQIRKEKARNESNGLTLSSQIAKINGGGVV